MPGPSLPGRPLVRLGILLIALALGSLLALAQDATPNTPLALVGTVSYTIQYGDVLDVIAQRYNISLLCIINMNALTSTINLRPGDTILLSDTCPPYDGRYPLPSALTGQGGGVAPQVENVSVVTPEVSAEGQIYVIEYGDILDLIALSFNVDLACLIERNAISNPVGLHPGDVIVIPGGCPPYSGVSTLPPFYSRSGVTGATSAPPAVPTIELTLAPPTPGVTNPPAATLAAPTQEFADPGAVPTIRLTIELAPQVPPAVTPEAVG